MRFPVGHIEDILPIDQDDWSKVKIRHDLRFGDFDLTVEWCKQKFWNIHRMKILT